MLKLRQTFLRLLGITGVTGSLLAQSAVSGAGVTVPAGRIGGPAAAQVSAPLLGFFWDRDWRRLHPGVGIPGSGYAADAIELPDVPALIEIAPSHDYALAILSKSGKLVRI